MQKRYPFELGDRVRRQTACGFRVGVIGSETDVGCLVRWDDGSISIEPPSTLEYYPTVADVERRRNEIKESWDAVQEQQRAGAYRAKPIGEVEEISTLRERHGRTGSTGG